MSDASSQVAQAYRRFSELAATRSPLSARVALALSESQQALRAVVTLPARRRSPALVLAVLHDLALAGRAPALAAGYAAADEKAAAAAAVDILLRQTEEVLAIAVRRQLRTDQAGRYAALYPAVAAAARQVGAGAIGLVDVGRPAALNLNLGRVGIDYRPGHRLGDPTSPVQVSCTVVGERSLPTQSVPEVVARIAVDEDPMDLTDPAEARWLRACQGPDRPEQLASLAAEVDLAATVPRLLLPGDPVQLLPEAVARVPLDALPIVTTSWALSSFPPERRQRFLQQLREAAADRPVAWVSAEGVGVAPTVPTLGDRPASGHSILGLVTFGRSAMSVQALGRCWSRGALLAWLA